MKGCLFQSHAKSVLKNTNRKRLDMELGGREACWRDWSSRRGEMEEVDMIIILCTYVWILKFKTLF